MMSQKWPSTSSGAISNGTTFMTSGAILAKPDSPSHAGTQAAGTDWSTWSFQMGRRDQFWQPRAL
jgi:hypothetical protein